MNRKRQELRLTKKEQRFCSIISDMLQSKLVQIWLTAAISPQCSSFEFALNVSAQSNMKAHKTSVYLLLTGPPSLHCGRVLPQLRLCSLAHWAVHHRWHRLLWKLAAVLPLGKSHLNGAKMAPGKPCDAKDIFLHLSLGNPVYHAVIE